jgi:hypothetical protein
MGARAAIEWNQDKLQWDSSDSTRTMIDAQQRRVDTPSCRESRRAAPSAATVDT